jgi:hypothetical protein
MEITNFISKLNKHQNSIICRDGSVIEITIVFHPQHLKMGTHHNLGENSWLDVKFFAFAELNNLSAAETLNCFGAYYHEEVLANPEGTNHQNIRNFMKTTGWDCILHLELKKTVCKYGKQYLF